MVVELAEGVPERVIVDRSARADLVVLGLSDPAWLVMPSAGPVVRACLEHAACAVVVVGAADRAPVPGDRPLAEPPSEPGPGPRAGARMGSRLAAGGAVVASKNGKAKTATAQELAEQVPRKPYEKELYRLQAELMKVQEWVRAEGARIVVIFEGRDAAGKGGTIKRVSPVPQPARGPDRRAARADRAGAVAVVLPALRRATCPPRARWCCSTAAGTTAPGSST